MYLCPLLKSCKLCECKIHGFLSNNIDYDYWVNLPKLKKVISFRNMNITQVYNNKSVYPSPVNS